MRVDTRLCLFRSAVLLRRSLQKQIVRIELNLYANKHERVGEKIKPARPRDVDGKRSPRLAQGFLFLIQQFNRRHFQLKIYDEKGLKVIINSVSALESCSTIYSLNFKHVREKILSVCDKQSVLVRMQLSTEGCSRRRRFFYRFLITHGTWHPRNNTRA